MQQLPGPAWHGIRSSALALVQIPWLPGLTPRAEDLPARGAGSGAREADALEKGVQCLACPRFDTATKQQGLLALTPTVWRATTWGREKMSAQGARPAGCCCPLVVTPSATCTLLGTSAPGAPGPARGLSVCGQEWI